MSESWTTRGERFLFNIFPAYRGCGARVTYIAADYTRIDIKLPLNWRTRNYVGTIFGGSLFSSVDPMYMIMLIKQLGPEYVVWDKAAAVRYRRPGRGTLYASFRMHKEEVEEIRKALETEDSLDRVYEIDLVDEDGVVHAEIEKTIYITKKGD